MNAIKNSCLFISGCSYFIFLILVIPLLLAACNDSSAKSKDEYIKESGENISFEIGGETFKVNKKYYQGRGVTHWGVLDNVRFWALLPNYKTYDKSLNHNEFVEINGWGSKLLFKLRLKRTKLASIPKMVEINKIKGRGMQFSGRLGNPDEIIYGLEAYYAKKYALDDYLYRTNGLPQVHITCRSKNMNVPQPGCDMLWDYSDTISLEASFSKKYLHQWKDILLHINKVIKGTSRKD
jgi:hypothetical protein